MPDRLRAEPVDAGDLRDALVGGLAIVANSLRAIDQGLAASNVVARCMILPSPTSQLGPVGFPRAVFRLPRMPRSGIVAEVEGLQTADSLPLLAAAG